MRRHQRGFTYFGALFLVLLMGAALAGIGQTWSAASVRAKERELLWVGTQYAQALRSYYGATPGLGQYPASLDELLDDRRFPGGMRHLRRLYPDPITKSTDWGLVHTVDHRIAGVYSRSEQAPRKTDRFPPEWTDFSGKQRYSEWRFVALRVFQDDLRRRSSAGSTAVAPEPGSPTIPAAPGSLTSPLPSSPLTPPSDFAGFASDEPVATEPGTAEPGATEPAAKPPIVTLPRLPRVDPLPLFSGRGRR